MNNTIEEWLDELADISELQECLVDVFENSMYKNKQPFYSLSLLTQIKERSEKLYDAMDRFCLKDNND